MANATELKKELQKLVGIIAGDDDFPLETFDKAKETISALKEVDLKKRLRESLPPLSTGQEIIEQTFVAEKPEAKTHHHHQKKKRNEDSDSLVGEHQAKSPADQKGKAEESTTSDSMGTNSKMVDTTCRKVKPFIPLYLDDPKRINRDLLPKGPVVFVGHLSRQVKYSDVENFFKGCGEILNIRFFLNEYQMFEGHGYVEFKTREAAEKAFKLHEQLLNDRPVILDLGNPWGPQFEFPIEYSRDLKPKRHCKHKWVVNGP